jgi:hypothetical protein
MVGEKNGRYDVWYPETYEELIGMKIEIGGTGKLYVIKGIFGTDFKQYEKLMYGSSIGSMEDYRKYFNFERMKTYIYQRVLVKPGFLEEINKNRDDLLLQSQYYFNYPNYGMGSYGDFKAYNRAELQKYLAWGTLPETLADNEMIITFGVAQSMSWNLTLENINTNQEFLDKINNFTFSAEQALYNTNTVLLNIPNAEIVAVINMENIEEVNPQEEKWYYGQNILYFSDKNIETIKAGMFGFNKLLFNPGQNQAEIENNFNALREENLFAGNAFADELINTENTFRQVANIFFIIALVVGVCPWRAKAKGGIGSPASCRSAFTVCWRRQSDVVQLELPV